MTFKQLVTRECVLTLVLCPLLFTGLDTQSSYRDTLFNDGCSYLIPPSSLYSSTTNMSSERGSKDYSVSTIPRSKEYIEHIENTQDGTGFVTSNRELEHYTKYPNRWSRIR